VPFFHDLQEQLQRFGVGFFHLIEHYDAVGLTAQRFGKLSGFFVTDITRGRADQPADGVPLHKFGHVNLYQRFFAAKQLFRQRLGQFGFPHAGWTEEHKRTDRSAGILEARSRTAHRFGDGFYGFLLPDDAPGEFLFQVEQTGGFLLRDLGQRDASPHRDNLADVFSAHGRRAFAVPTGLHCLQRFFKTGLPGQERLDRVVILCRAGSFQVFADFAQFIHQVFTAHRGFALVHAHARGGFVHQVDGLVRQKAVGHVAGGELRGSFQGFVRDVQAVVLFVIRSQAL